MAELIGWLRGRPLYSLSGGGGADGDGDGGDAFGGLAGDLEASALGGAGTGRGTGETAGSIGGPGLGSTAQGALGGGPSTGPLSRAGGATLGAIPEGNVVVPPPPRAVTIVDTRRGGGDGGDGGAGGAAPVQIPTLSLPEPPVIPPAPLPPTPGTPEDISGGGANVQDLVAAVERARKFGREGTILTSPLGLTLPPEELAVPRLTAPTTTQPRAPGEEEEPSETRATAPATRESTRRPRIRRRSSALTAP